MKKVYRDTGLHTEDKARIFAVQGCKKCNGTGRLGYLRKESRWIPCRCVVVEAKKQEAPAA